MDYNIREIQLHNRNYYYCNYAIVELLDANICYFYSKNSAGLFTPEGPFLKTCV